MQEKHPNIEVIGHYENSKTPVKLKCKIDGYEWFSIPDNSLNGNRGCPVCASKTVMKGINDMWTTHPEIASLLADPEEGYIFSAHSNKKTWWKCPNCGEKVYRGISSITARRGVPCPICGDHYSYPEKFVYNLLKYLNIDFIFQYRPEWIAPKKYDFYIPVFNVIIETNGIQHYKESDFTSRSLEEEIQNDKYKETMAVNQGLDIIWLDCRFSGLEYIKQSILNSRINSFISLDNVDWDYIDKSSLRSIVYDTCIKWKNGNYLSATKLSEEIKLHYVTVIGYLKLGNKYGWCHYDPRESYHGFLPQKVMQLTKEKELIKIWDST